MTTKPNNINSSEQELTVILLDENNPARFFTRYKERAKFDSLIRKLQFLITTHEQQVRREGVRQFAYWQFRENKEVKLNGKVDDTTAKYIEEDINKFLEENPSA